MVITRFIEIANHCKHLRNFNCLMEIISGLSLPVVQRLKQTWASLHKQDVEVYTKLKKLMSRENNNYKKYREKLKDRKKTEPTIPYIGLCLQDILQTELLPTHLETGMINFKKLRRLSSVIGTDIAENQKQHYKFEVEENIQRFLSHIRANTDDIELLQHSRLCEPQEEY